MAILGYKNSITSIRNCGLAEWLKTRGLAGWLEIATDGLEAPARRRIACEIGSHYSEAVSVHLAEGEPECSAHSTALAELGDPQKAALNFRKSHLTEYEARSMKWMEWTAAKPLFSFWALLLDGIPLGGAALLFSYLHGNPRLPVNFRYIVGLVLVAYAGFRLIPRLLCARTLRRNSLLRKLALCELTTQAFVLPAFWLVQLMQVHDGFRVFDAVFVFYLYGYALNPGFRIWKKLRKMDNGQNDLPPSQTIAS